ncbi:unnamed protein product [Bursaphelenchus okinawaensis]|uniref:Zinc finger protein-like 1 homolog n=1 Tax=Bursaphelenchus okinawaensis TaxID=465554 RepID=A0A811L8W4_9BILA|nr:unnamed protein product [Bursaphelenchus okinawaensis]CAG9120172.1 unnamed protein product [Bursaphelenchus okinawaensis]
MVSNNLTLQCVVQTYLSWLTDSDYDTKCLLCSEALSAKETVRLKCLHNFHWTCLSTRVGNLPEGTPPTTFKCPSCLDMIFPSANQTSPVIERLREKLSTVNWGRLGLGMEPKAGLDNVLEQKQLPKKTFTVDMSYDTRPSLQTTSRGKQAQLPVEQRPLIQNDSDLNDVKYLKRQSSFRFSRLPKTVKRSLIAMLAIGGIFLVLWVFSGRSSDNESLFDPHANPNIRVEPNNL